MYPISTSTDTYLIRPCRILGRDFSFIKMKALHRRQWKNETALYIYMYPAEGVILSLRQLLSAVNVTHFSPRPLSHTHEMQ